jgi:hypothetical protein
MLSSRCHPQRRLKPGAILGSQKRHRLRGRRIVRRSLVYRIIPRRHQRRNSLRWRCVGRRVCREPWRHSGLWRISGAEPGGCGRGWVR